MSAEPTLAEIVRRALDARLLDVHVALPGRVEKYTAATNTADVLPLVRRAIEDSAGGLAHEDLPVVPNVPVHFPRGGGTSITWKLAKGDHVLLVFCSSAIGQWQESGELSDPGDLRRHDLSHAIAIAGVSPQASPAPTDPGDLLLIESPEVKIGAAAVDFVAMNQKVIAELTSIATALNTHTHSVTGGGGGTASATPGLYTAPADVASTKLKSES